MAAFDEAVTPGISGGETAEDFVPLFSFEEAAAMVAADDDAAALMVATDDAAAAAAAAAPMVADDAADDAATAAAPIAPMVVTDDDAAALLKLSKLAQQQHSACKSVDSEVIYRLLREYRHSGGTPPGWEVLEWHEDWKSTTCGQGEPKLAFLVNKGGEGKKKRPRLEDGKKKLGFMSPTASSHKVYELDTKRGLMKSQLKLNSADHGMKEGALYTLYQEKPGGAHTKKKKQEHLSFDFDLEAKLDTEGGCAVLQTLPLRRKEQEGADSGADLLLPNGSMTVRDDLSVGGSITAQGDITYGGVLKTSRADFAEWLPSEEEIIEAASVVQVRGGPRVTLHAEPDKGLCFVVSTAPAICANSPANSTGGCYVAMVGQVPVRAVGEVAFGEPLYPTGDGAATATKNGDFEAFATAWGDKKEHGESLVLCFVGGQRRVSRVPRSAALLLGVRSQASLDRYSEAALREMVRQARHLRVDPEVGAAASLEALRGEDEDEDEDEENVVALMAVALASVWNSDDRAEDEENSPPSSSSTKVESERIAEEAAMSLGETAPDERDHLRHIMRKLKTPREQESLVSLVNEALSIHDDGQNPELCFTKDGKLRTPGGIFFKLLKEKKIQRRVAEAESTAAASAATTKGVLRPYQSEVVDECLAAGNALLYLDTGTGKTLVIAAIIEKLHLDKKQPKLRVLFLEKTQALVEQQAAVLKRHFSDHQITVQGFHGALRLPMGGIPAAMGLMAPRPGICDVLVTTPAYALENDVEGAMDDIDLVGIDEVHDAKKNHPYAKLLALCNTTDKQQRVIGLTATPAAAMTQERTDRELVALLSKLKGKFVTVRVETKSLEEHSTAVLPKYLPVEPRSSDTEARERVVGLMNEAMEILETWSELPAGSSKMELDSDGFASSFENLRRRALKDNNEKVALLSSMLSTTSRTLVTMRAVGWEPALSPLASMLLDLISARDEDSLPEWAVRELLPHFTTLGDFAVRLAEHQEQRAPKVVELQRILAEAATAYEKMKAIVFVKTRLAAESIYRQLGSEAAGALKPQLFIGHGNGHGGPGMTTAAQMRALRLFREGKINVLVATSLAEEGINVPDCNVVVRFDSVDGAISETQSGGRARMPNARFYVLYEDGSARDIRGIHKSAAQKVHMREACVRAAKNSAAT